MKFLKVLVPNYIAELLKKISISLLLLFLTRFIFYFVNQESFINVNIYDFLVSFWIDIVTISIFFLPFYTLYLIPNKNRNNKYYQTFFKVLFHVINSVILFLNLIDVEYFQYTNKRSTADLLSILQAGNDFSQLIFSFITDFWWLILIYVGFIYLVNKIYKLTEKSNSENIDLKKQSLYFVFYIFIFLFMSRGTVALRPLSVIDISKYTSIENVPLVLNTPFTFIKSIGKEQLNEKDYFSLEEEKELFNPIKTSTPQQYFEGNPNIMIIILESFGNEFIGTYNKDKSFTPFFDSILKNSLHFEFGVANGKKSIEAVPSIIASIPSLMDNPYISSSYSSNKINTLPNLLKKSGYTSAFFHGATNGSMRFDSFAKQAGFDHYFGRTEYGNDMHFDKTWGILDEYFNPWTAKKINELKEPFLGTLFTLSSHHPYFIPKHMKKKVIKGNQPICASINYSDYSLRQFFKEAKKYEWYNNTIFVFCADHTPATKTVSYSTRSQIFRIPIAFYDPLKRIKPKREYKVFQQIDIFPTLLDLANINTKYYAFGNSYYSKKQINEGICYLEGSYQYFFKNYTLLFSNDKARNLYDFTVRAKQDKNVIQLHRKEIFKGEKRLKAIIQRYNRDLIQNKTTTE